MLQIVHTNDFHDRLTEAAADRLAGMKRDLSECGGLLLDAGDAGGSGNLTFRMGGEPILERMSRIGYDAMTVGNRDFHLTRTGFRCKLMRATFPILSANAFPTPMPTAALLSQTVLLERADDMPVYRYIVRETKGWRILILGLTVPMITPQMLSRKVSAYVFEAPLRCAQRLVPALRERFAPDLFIALTHIGFTRDQELASAVPGIDLIIGGHSHTVLESGVQVDNTLIVQAGSRGSHLGLVEVEKRRDTGVLTLRSKLEAL